MTDRRGPLLMSVAGAAPEAPLDCTLCDRLAEFRRQNAIAAPDWFNAPVPSFGATDARLLIVGLAPGLNGANRTGRPFTGDYAGDLLYATLADFGFSRGAYQAHAGDGLELVDCMITNAVRCVPPQNKPTPAEIKTCRPYFVARIAALPRLEAMVALGRIAHDQILDALGLRKSAHPFAHGARHEIVHAPSGARLDGVANDTGRKVTLFDSFHCSRYNTNTGRLTPEMFRTVFAAVRRQLDP